MAFVVTETFHDIKLFDYLRADIASPYSYENSSTAAGVKMAPGRILPKDTHHLYGGDVIAMDVHSPQGRPSTSADTTL